MTCPCEGIAASGVRELFGETPPASYGDVLHALDRCQVS